MYLQQVFEFPFFFYCKKIYNTRASSVHMIFHSQDLYTYDFFWEVQGKWSKKRQKL